MDKDYRSKRLSGLTFLDNHEIVSTRSRALRRAQRLYQKSKKGKIVKARKQKKYSQSHKQELRIKRNLKRERLRILILQMLGDKCINCNWIKRYERKEAPPYE